MRTTVFFVALAAALAAAGTGNVGARGLPAGVFPHVPVRGAGSSSVRSGTGGPALVQRWQDYSPQEREQALKNYERHRRTSPERRWEIERGYERWRQMPEEDRRRIRRNYEQYRELPKEERREFNQNFQQWKEEVRPESER